VVRPGIGLLGVFSLQPTRMKHSGILRIAVRRWNGYGMKINLGKLSLLVAAFSLAAQCNGNAVPPLPQAHAHNDYEHPRPLFDALDQGFCSVEADVHLVNGVLLVAHDSDKVDPKRTLESLYLEPLRLRVKANKGAVYPSGPPLLLLVDIKTEAEPTYAALQPLLKRYREMLTEFTTHTTRTGTVTVVLSGNRPIESVAAESVRYASIDGRLPDLENDSSRHLIPLVSDNWTKHFQWRGEGEISAQDRMKLASFVSKAHAQGRRIRFWGLPDTRDAWKLMLDSGVDLINTDDLAGLQKFLTAK
jgi:glycerophosphoryl diester phosphodiesterase